MTASTRIPKRVQEVLRTHRRNFLKNAGLLVVSFGAGGGGRQAPAQSLSTAKSQVRIPTRISGNWTHGLSFTRTTLPRFMSAKRT